MFRAHCLHRLPPAPTLLVNPRQSAFASQALTRMHSLSSGSESPSLLPARPLSSPNGFAFPAPSALASVPCQPPNATPFSYSPVHFPTRASLGARLQPLILQGSIPSPFSILVPTNGLGLPGVHRPGSRASRAQIGHLAPAFAGSLWEGGSAGAEPGACKSGEEGRIRRRGVCLGGRPGSRRGWWLCLQHRARWPSASLSAAAEAPLPHRAPTSRYCCSSLLPLSVAQLPARREASPSCQTPCATLPQLSHPPLP